MNNIEIMKFCDEKLRYKGSNTGIRGISFNPHTEMFAIRHKREHFGTDCFLGEAFRTLIEVAYRIPMTLNEQHYALLYLASPANKIPATEAKQNDQ